MKYKAIVCDLDGTLLNENHTISQKTKEIIKKVLNKGIKFIIATGRHHEDVMIYKKMLNLDTFLITSNGAKVHDYNDKEILSYNIPKNISKEIIEFDFDKDIHKNVYVDNQWITETPLKEAEEFHKESGFTYTLSPFSSLKGKEIIKFFFISDNIVKLSDLEKIMRVQFSDKVNITLSLPHCLEIMDKNVSKANALKKVLKIENISLEETIAFGDGLNDLEMLSSVGAGYIMGNGSERLKELLPENEVISKNSEDGVAKKIEELFL